MFVANKDHLDDFFGTWEKILSPKKLERLKKTSGYLFYKLIFCNVREEDFSVLYSDHLLSSPNSAVNCLVCALFLMHKYNWSADELMRQIDFNIEVQVALGLKNMEIRPFSRKTLFNFKIRLWTHHEKTGENLLERVFEYMTASQIESLMIKTNIQRGDTVMMNTNIGIYSRLSLLAEVLNRVYRILDKSDQQLYAALFGDYTDGGEKYVYKMADGSKEEKLEQLAKAYYSVYNLLGSKYLSNEVFQLFEQVYREHFKEVEKEEDKYQIPIRARPKEELGSNIIQSPDDGDATYRKKRGESYKGYSLFGAETCHPDNDIDLITKIVAVTNNTDDSTILEDHLEQMVEATPNLDEIHLDGGFGSQQVDVIAEKEGVSIIQTAVKGRTAAAPIEVSGNETDGFQAQCSNKSHPAVKAEPTGKGFKVKFDLNNHCQGCPFYNQCPTNNSS